MDVRPNLLVQLNQEANIMIYSNNLQSFWAVANWLWGQCDIFFINTGWRLRWCAYYNTWQLLLLLRLRLLLLLLLLYYYYYYYYYYYCCCSCSPQLPSFHQLSSSLRKSATTSGLSHRSRVVSCVGQAGHRNKCSTECGATPQSGQTSVAPAVMWAL